GRARWRQDGVVGATCVTQVGTPARAASLTRAEEVEAAQLETLAEIPDAVERRPVPLVGRRELVQRSHVRRERASVRSQLRRDLRSRIERREERARDGADA